MNDRFVERLLQEFAGHKGVLKGPANPKVLVGTNPAAGNDVAVTDFVVPVGKIWVPRSFTIVCAQGITQTPLPALAWDDGTNVLGTIAGAAAALSASVTSRFSWLRHWLGAPTAGAGLTANTAALPLLVLEAGYRLYTITAGIGANTDYAAPVLKYDEFAV